MNPVLPRQHFVPDCEARKMPDGRLYVYGSYDIGGQNSYCSTVLHAFSTENMVDWIDHGVCLESKDIPFADPERELYAPDCIYRDGKYYLYFCMNGGIEGVAVSETPYGPFSDVAPIEGANGDGIDPAVFVDEDGQAYYYWGQFHLRGAKLNEDMKSLDLTTLQTNLIDEKRHGFHEGSSMRKANGWYYLTYTDISRGKATCIGYAMARSPLGPFEYKGILVDNTGCDPNTWNNHGSIEQFQNQWYVFYHRSSQNSIYNRRLCIEPIFFNDKYEIEEVEMTSQGCENPLSIKKDLDASCACKIGGFGTYPCIKPDPLHKGEEILADLTGNGWAVYKYLRFEADKTRIEVTGECTGSGVLEIWNQREKIGEIFLENTNGQRHTFGSSVKKGWGVGALYLEWHMEKESKGAIKTIRFCTEK